MFFVIEPGESQWVKSTRQFVALCAASPSFLSVQGPLQVVSDGGRGHGQRHVGSHDGPPDQAHSATAPFACTFPLTVGL